MGNDRITYQRPLKPAQWITMYFLFCLFFCCFYLSTLRFYFSYPNLRDGNLLFQSLCATVFTSKVGWMYVLHFFFFFVAAYSYHFPVCIFFFFLVSWCCEKAIIKKKKLFYYITLFQLIGKLIFNTAFLGPCSKVHSPIYTEYILNITVPAFYV